MQHLLTRSHVDLEARLCGRGGGNGFIHPLWCGCGAGNGGVMVIRLHCHVEASPPWSCGLWSESCGLHEGSYRVHNVCTWLTAYYPTPPWFGGLWSGHCGLHEVYGLFIEVC